MNGICMLRRESGRCTHALTLISHTRVDDDAGKLRGQSACSHRSKSGIIVARTIAHALALPKCAGLLEKVAAEKSGLSPTVTVFYFLWNEAQRAYKQFFVWWKLKAIDLQTFKWSQRFILLQTVELNLNADMSCMLPVRRCDNVSTTLFFLQGKGKYAQIWKTWNWLQNKSI